MFPPTQCTGMAEHRAAGDLGAGETTDDLLEALNERRRRLLELRHLRHDADDTAPRLARRQVARSRGATRGPYRGGAIPAPRAAWTTRARWPAHGASRPSISSVPRPAGQREGHEVREVGIADAHRVRVPERLKRHLCRGPGADPRDGPQGGREIAAPARRQRARAAAPMASSRALAGRRRSTTARRGSIPSATRRHGGIASTSAGAGAASSASGPGARFPCHRTRRR